MVTLAGGEFQRCRNVFGLQVGVILDNLIARSAGSKQIQNILDADA